MDSDYIEKDQGKLGPGILLGAHKELACHEDRHGGHLAEYLGL
jgi:hypothetical protein